MCDTFVSIVPDKKGKSIIFGKNSDREPNEAQVLEYNPPQKFSLKDKVNCTYLTISQVKETNGVLLSRPFWMWGAEMGANDKGVVIGNEAVFTRMPTKESDGLTGMDMVRLALERSDSAQQALDVLIGLLVDYGQGGSCGYKDKKMVYHNSYIIADSDEAWILETADDMWVTVKVHEFYSISNGLTIGEEFDQHHPKLIETAKNKGWLKNGKSFNFAECYSDWFATKRLGAKQRQAFTYEHSARMLDTLDIRRAFWLLRNHIKEPYKADGHFLQNTICVHAGNKLTRNAGTTASFVAHLREKGNVFWATATSSPCTSFFKPIWFDNDVLPDLGPKPKGRFNSKSYWWHHERFHRLVMRDFERFEEFREERDRMEDSFVKYAYRKKPQDRFAYTLETFKSSKETTKKWFQTLRSEKKRPRNGILFNRYWRKQNKMAELEF